MTIPQKGAAAALLSYLWWGSMPLYWKTLLSVSSFEILGHRVVWSAVFTLALIILTGQGGKAVAFAAKNRQKTLWLFLGGYLITVFTLGICYPWAVVMTYRWQAKHTYLNGRRLRFTGTAPGLFGHWIKWFLLIIVTLGIYSFWVWPKLTKWIVEHQEYDPLG